MPAKPPIQPPSPPFDEAAEGDRLPDPVLPIRALTELRAAFGPQLSVPAEADRRVLDELHLSVKRRQRSASFWRGFQIAAVFAIVASLMYYGGRDRSSDRTRLPSLNDRMAAGTKEEVGKDLGSVTGGVRSASPSPTLPLAASAPATLASNVTILDAFNLARKIENESKKFKPTGERVNEWEEVDKLAAAVIDADPAQVRELRNAPALRDDAFAQNGYADGEFSLADAPARTELDGVKRVAKAPTADRPLSDKAITEKPGTRILSYDIMLDVGSRSLAAFQVEVSMAAPDTAHVTLIWVRGGEHPALNRQPLYNAKRLVNPPQHIAFNVANFDTGRDLPSGDIHVARVVLVVVGKGTPGVTARLVVAAGPEGAHIPAGLRVVERAPVLNPEAPHKTLDTPASPVGDR